MSRPIHALSAARPPAELLLLGLFAVLLAGPARADGEAGGFSEEEIRFESGDVTLHGTVLVPEEASPGRKPAIVLVHGAGPHTREDQRNEAEAFARKGIVTLISTTSGPKGTRG